jgi:hypothetical protein
MRTSAAIIASFAALAASAPLSSRALPVEVPELPVVGGLLPDVGSVASGVAVPALPELAAPSVPGLDIKRDISAPVVSMNDIAENADVNAAINNLVTKLGGVAKRQVSVPVVSSSIHNSHDHWLTSSALR